MFRFEDMLYAGNVNKREKIIIKVETIIQYFRVAVYFN